MAFRIRGGDIGSSFILIPTELETALAIAAKGGQIEVSPTPLTPYGCPGLGTSTITVSILGKSEATGIRSVSYTHLTLPTICSV